MNAKRNFVFCGAPGSLHEIVSDVVWSTLRSESSVVAGRIDFDFDNYGDLRSCNLSQFFSLMSAMATLMEAMRKMDQEAIVCSGYPTLRIPCLGIHSPVPSDLHWKCVEALDAPIIELTFVVDAKDEIISNRIHARRQSADEGVLGRTIAFYRAIPKAGNVVFLDTSDGPKQAADEAVERIRKVYK